MLNGFCNCAVCRTVHGHHRCLTAALKDFKLLADNWPQEGREDKSRCHMLALGNTLVGIPHGRLNQCQCFVVLLDACAGARK